MRAGRIFLANVGVNASHRLISPLGSDGSFSLVPIPEEGNPVRYGDVAHLRGLVPEAYWGSGTHYDPEWETRTYGDNCGWAPRAAALKGCAPGDFIFFIARLVGPLGPAFALVGFLEIEEVARDVRAMPAERFEANAHVRRGRWDGFWVFAGSPRSRLLPRAALIGREEAELLLRDRAGAAWNWRDGRSVLQTIGSYTRSCRYIIDPARERERALAFWTWLAQCVGLEPLWP